MCTVLQQEALFNALNFEFKFYVKFAIQWIGFQRDMLPNQRHKSCQSYMFISNTIEFSHFVVFFSCSIFVAPFRHSSCILLASKTKVREKSTGRQKDEEKLRFSLVLDPPRTK